MEGGTRVASLCLGGKLQRRRALALLLWCSITLNKPLMLPTHISISRGLCRLG